MSIFKTRPLDLVGCSGKRIQVTECVRGTLCSHTTRLINITTRIQTQQDHLYRDDNGLTIAATSICVSVIHNYNRPVTTMLIKTHRNLPPQWHTLSLPYTQSSSVFERHTHTTNTIHNGDKREFQSRPMTVAAFTTHPPSTAAIIKNTSSGRDGAYVDVISFF